MSFNQKSKHVVVSMWLALLACGTEAAEFLTPESDDASDVITVKKSRRIAPPAIAAQIGETAPAPEKSATKAYQLKQGEAIHSQLNSWAKEESWVFMWRLAKSWRVPADITVTAIDCADAINQVITGLYEEGKPVKLVGNKGNQFMEVVSNEVR
jgi:hypothetical protein